MTSDSAGVGRARITQLRGAVRQLLGAERRLRRRSQAAPDRLSYAQMLTLAVLANNPDQTARQLAARAGLDPGSLTTVLDQLEALGAIQRNRNPTNRRAYVVSDTPYGRQLAAPSLARWLAEWDQRLAGYSDSQLATAAEVIAAISDLFDAVPECGVTPALEARRSTTSTQD